jgi:hypothetical protein
MSVTDNDRRLLHDAFEQSCGERPAEVLMELLPPAGWNDLVRSRDLDLAVSELRSEIRSLGSDLRAEMSAFRAETERAMRSQTWKMVTAMIACQTLAISAMAYIVR